MNPKKRYKIVLYVPESHTDQLLTAIGDAGAGIIGNYSHCSFIIKGTSRFMPLDGANPTMGKVGKMENVSEDRIETICEEDKLKAVMKTIKDVHPYEEPATDVYPIEVFE